MKIKKTMDIKKTLKDNLQTIIALFAIGSTIFGVFNFYILSKLAPIERRVEAIEIRNEKREPLLGEFIEAKTDIRDIKEDIKDIKSFLGIR